MAKHEVFGIFNTFLDEATDNESFGFNITESEQLILGDSLHKVSTLEVSRPVHP